MLIRPARDKDLVPIRALLDESPRYVYRHHDYSYLVMFRYFEGYCFIAEIEEEIVGFVTGFPSGALPDTCFLWQLVVGSSVRRSGIGTKLVAHFVDASLEVGCRHVEFTTTSDTSLALFKRFARGRGFAFKTIDKLSFRNRDTNASEEELLHRISFR